MLTQTKNFKEDKKDAGLLFVTGLFFLTLAFAVAYFSYFGLTPLLKSPKMGNVSAAAVATVSNPEPVLEDTVNSSQELVQKQNGVFVTSLPAVPVKEIFIGSYGAVNEEVLEGVRGEIEKTFGVKTTLLHPGPAIPKEEPFYSNERKQYDTDVLFTGIKDSSEVYGTTVRFLYVVDLNMSSFSKQLSGASWLRADNGTNAALVSLHDFHANNNQLNKEDSQKILLERGGKIALRALGITVGFDTLLSATDASCLMYPVFTLQELDAGPSVLCQPELEAVTRVF